MLISATTEGVMDCDAMYLLTGTASPLLNLIGFLIFSAIALCAMRGSGDRGHHQPCFWAGMARVALARGA